MLPSQARAQSRRRVYPARRLLMTRGRYHRPFGKRNHAGTSGRMSSSAEERRRHGGTMTGMPASEGEDRSEPPAESAQFAVSSSEDGSSRRQGAAAATRSIWVLEHVQDWVTVAVGVVLIALAVVLLIAGIVDFLDGSSGPISAGAPILLDRVLLVLILVEIVYTVVLSLRAHRLVAQPFIVVGLIAVVRRILFVLDSRQHCHCQHVGARVAHCDGGRVYRRACRGQPLREGR